MPWKEPDRVLLRVPIYACSLTIVGGLAFGLVVLANQSNADPSDVFWTYRKGFGAAGFAAVTAMIVLREARHLMSPIELSIHRIFRATGLFACLVWVIAEGVAGTHPPR